MSVTASEFASLLETAHALADASGAVLKSRFRRRIAVENKAGPKQAGTRTFDPVTAADRAAERVIARHLKSRHPDHGMLGEEYGAAGGGARHQWVIDPIDGTRAFILGMPTWGTLIGLKVDGAPLLGVMDQPYIGERIWSEQRSARMRSSDGTVRSIKARSCPDLAAALVMTTSPDMFADGLESACFVDVKAHARMVRYGGDCYAYCMLAAGHVDIVMEAGLQPYDVVALIPIIERAGGRMTTWDGRSAAEGGRVLACGDARLHDKVLARLARTAA